MHSINFDSNKAEPLPLDNKILVIETKLPAV
jgi:hypothetical protein